MTYKPAEGGAQHIQRLCGFNLSQLNEGLKSMDTTTAVPDSPRLEAQARRLAAKHGYIARKSRMYRPPDSWGGFAIIDISLNVPVAGWSFDLSAQDVIDWFNE